MYLTKAAPFFTSEMTVRLSGPSESPSTSRSASATSMLLLVGSVVVEGSGSRSALAMSRLTAESGMDGSGSYSVSYLCDFVCTGGPIRFIHRILKYSASTPY